MLLWLRLWCVGNRGAALTGQEQGRIIAGGSTVDKTERCCSSKRLTPLEVRNGLAIK